jgi:hypothetical protein
VGASERGPLLDDLLGVRLFGYITFRVAMAALGRSLAIWFDRRTRAQSRARETRQSWTISARKRLPRRCKHDRVARRQLPRRTIARVGAPVGATDNLHVRRCC